MKPIYAIIVLTILAVIFVGKAFMSTPTPTSNPPLTSPSPSRPATQVTPPELISLDSTKTYQALIKTTKGDLTVQLDTTQTPITAANFITLAQKNFYDKTIFHRVIKGFMIQGGDPQGTGMGGPGYKFADEPITGSYTRGTIAMANSGKNTNGSQFFIMHQDYALPPQYVIFGKVIAGLEVIDKLASVPVQANSSGEASSPISPDSILSIAIQVL